MKNIILIGTFIISLFVTSCNKENLPDKGTANSKTITISANISDDPETRLTYTEESNKLKLGWSEGEKFTMYRGTHSTGEEFTKASGNNNFSGKDPNPTGTGDYYAVYGSNISNASGVLTVDITNQTGTKDTDNGINSFMVASSTKIDDGSTLNFAHKLTILKLELTFPKGTTGTVKEVIITGLHNKANYTLSKTTDNYDYTDDNKKDIKATNNGSGFTIIDDKITAYISVFPESVAAKQVTIKAVTEAVDYSYTMQNAKTLNVGNLVPVSVELAEMGEIIKTEYTRYDYYQWDAYLPYEYMPGGGTWGPTSSYYNKTTKELASVSCKDCPTAEQMVAYLKEGVYYDDNNTVTEGQRTYKISDVSTTEYHIGLWVKKRRYIKNFYSETEKTYTTTTETFKQLSKLTNEQVKNIRTSGEYFFLPACGGYLSGSFYYAGTLGGYWSSTPNATDTYSAYYLGFSSGGANVGSDGVYASRINGFVPMPRL